VPKKRKPTSKKVGKKAAALPPRDSKQSASRQAATKAKAPRAKKPALRPRVRVTAQPPDVTDQKALLRDNLGKKEGPARAREQPEELIRGAAGDDLAEELGEEFVESATSGEQAADMRDEEVPEESGGPFVETSGRSEFAYGTDASNPKDAECAPFPTTRRAPSSKGLWQSRGMIPAECLSELWKRVGDAFAKASLRGTRAIGAVSYRVVHGIGLEGGDYLWNNGLPRIWLLREREPADVFRPDLNTNPLQDAFTLAHEYGHFLSDKDGSRTLSLFEKLRAKQPLKHAEKNVIVDEERRAWANGRKILEGLGYLELDAYDEFARDCVDGYVNGLAIHPEAAD
jgi:hypothetical protein